MTLVIFLLILSLLVLVHEFGHFIIAKRLGIRVEEFGLGIPPRIFAKQIGETVYSLNLLPFGGFVKVTGEDSSEAVGGVSDPRSFAAKKPGQRALVLGAGVFMNLALAIAVFYIVLFSSNLRTQYIPTIFEHKFKFGTEYKIGTVVGAVMPDSAAQKAGIEAGETVLSVGGATVSDVKELRAALVGKLGQEVVVRLQDVRNDLNGPIREVRLKPQTDKDGNVILGVYLTEAVSIDYSKPYQKPLAGFLHTYNVLDFTVSSLGKIIGMSFQEGSLDPVSQSVAGPVGIYELIGGLIQYGGKRVVLSLLDFIGIMSVSLAFINILPLPALDGGRILFVAIEKVLGRPLSPKIESATHRIGFALLLGLLVLVTIKDIVN